ncbi:hypothetical protein E2C01_085538 [Portunus trituberculatus]|uniref:SGNH domain-containing protein n=1 Tax=Portunus trituberculatus TaxID=210409 RepID=A0A5B7J958_PORTR|nr:hypothetical protein [Portunus trituberculatus]
MHADEFSLPTGKILVVEDNQVRHLVSALCAKDRKRRTRLCLPGAEIERVSAQLDTCLEADGTKPIVFLSAGEMTFARLGDHCRSNGWALIDNWDLFYGKDTLYARDGVHFSRQGVRVLAETLEGKLNALWRFFRYSGEGMDFSDS